MSAETPNPQPGDRVRITFEGQYVGHNPGPSEHCVNVGLPSWVRIPDALAAAAVEVLERADDPSKDLVGTMRREEHDAGFVLYAKGADAGTAWVVVSSSALQLLGRRFEDEFVAEFPRAGAVPGTPAAEARAEQDAINVLVENRERVHPANDLTYRVGNHNPRNIYRTTGEGDRRDGDEHVGVMFSPEDGPRVVAALNASASLKPAVRVSNEPHGPSPTVRILMANRIAEGRAVEAVGIAHDAGMDWHAARVYVESMSEYQTYLSEHGRTEVDPAEADGMRAMGFDKQPEFQVSDEDRALIQSVLDERTTEYVYEQGDGSWKLDGTALAGVVADIVWAAIKRDRERGGR